MCSTAVGWRRSPHDLYLVEKQVFPVFRVFHMQHQSVSRPSRCSTVFQKNPIISNGTRGTPGTPHKRVPTASDREKFERQVLLKADTTERKGRVERRDQLLL